MDTQFDPLMVPPGTVDWQFGIVRRVELEERAYVAAKGLARLKDLAIHASAQCTNDARSARRGNKAGDMHGAIEMRGMGAAAGVKRARAMGLAIPGGYGRGPGGGRASHLCHCTSLFSPSTQ